MRDRIPPSAVNRMSIAYITHAKDDNEAAASSAKALPVSRESLQAAQPTGSQNFVVPSVPQKILPAPKAFPDFLSPTSAESATKKRRLETQASPKGEIPVDEHVLQGIDTGILSMLAYTLQECKPEDVGLESPPVAATPHHEMAHAAEHFFSDHNQPIPMTHDEPTAAEGAGGATSLNASASLTEENFLAMTHEIDLELWLKSL